MLRLLFILQLNVITQKVLRRSMFIGKLNYTIFSFNTQPKIWYGNNLSKYVCNTANSLFHYNTSFHFLEQFRHEILEVLYEYLEVIFS